MSNALRYVAIGLAVLIVLGLGSSMLRDDTPQPVQSLKHSYSKSLDQARNGQPGAARVLYQQLARTDLTPKRRIALLVQLPNYPSPQALKLADADLANPSAEVRLAAIDSIHGLVPGPQRSLLLGPLLDDQEQAIRFAATRALLGLNAVDLGLYSAPLDKVLDEYKQFLQAQTQSSSAQLQLARLYLHDGDFPPASEALARALKLDPDNLQAIATQVQLLDRQGLADQARQVLADQLTRHPDSAFLQQELGLWLLHHDQSEYALLAFARALELAPDNNDYRYTLAISLHSLDLIGPAQQQLEDILRRQPANRKARVLLIEYWKETGQLQNVQVLQAELEQQNPDDPALQQGL
ncbi:tetratricopeptide repeat protein [Pseudomonas sp. R5(2019)]|uniref:tetratricopeptide repeat protein n=1 Tax=Pseudomonas sp. R5(2019) TaxID=2697566 RepID=UPI001412BA2F|nr:tetratricopeptide repeat protein [Pseudomonas sp. R5(2019)]NBA97431.1 tetratricopeptide repeat protein [Pseudomonas sp. R5(2019)]